MHISSFFSVKSPKFFYLLIVCFKIETFWGQNNFGNSYLQKCLLRAPLFTLKGKGHWCNPSKIEYVLKEIALVFYESMVLNSLRS